jgi:D-tyrosyl-tRNA(Tyr) deacylase
MKVVVQRVKEASCTVNNEIISKIQDGLLLLVGFTHDDTIEDVHFLAKKIANLRIFEDDNQRMNKSILDMNYEILSISQFTLYGDTRKGNRPSFIDAMKPNKAKHLYEQLSSILTNVYGIKTYNGVFGEMMDIGLINSGPVTIELEK